MNICYRIIHKRPLFVYTNLISLRNIQSTYICLNKVKTKALYDGECPLCVKEIQFLKWIDKDKQNVDFVDITKDYKQEQHHNIPLEDAMSVMHVVGKNGKIYTRVEAMHELYGAMGMGWLWTWTKITGISTVADKLYMWFARNRLRITGKEWCETGRCAVKRK